MSQGGRSKIGRYLLQVVVQGPVSLVLHSLTGGRAQPWEPVCSYRVSASGGETDFEWTHIFACSISLARLARLTHSPPVAWDLTLQRSPSQKGSTIISPSEGDSMEHSTSRAAR